MRMSHVASVKLLETSIVSFTIREKQAIMPKTKRRANQTTTLDVTQADVIQLTRLTAEALRLHLAARHLVTTGNKAVMAQRLHDAIHAIPVSQQHDSTPPQLPATQQLPPPPLQPSLQPPPTVTGLTVTSSSFLPATSSLPSNVSYVLTQPIASSQIAPSSSLPTIANSTELAQLFNQFLRQATGRSAPQPLSPASINGNQQAQPTSTLPPPRNLQLPQQTVSALPPVQQTTTAMLPVNHQLLFQQTAPIQPQVIPAQPTCYQQVQPPIQPSSQQLPPQYAMQQLPVPVPIELQQQIIKGEYVDFAVLLDKTSFTDTAHTTHAHQTTHNATHKPTPITSFSMWMQAWNTYLTVILSHNPARALELVGYQRIITSASHTFPLKAWLRYDGQFRTMAASNPYLRWDQRHQELWYENMSSTTTTQRWPCPYCGAKNHYPDNCPHSPFRDSSQRSRPPNRRTPGTPICGDFNNGQCTRNACSFQHICLTCKGPHPRISCSDRRPATHTQ